MLYSKPELDNLNTITAAECCGSCPMCELVGSDIDFIHVLVQLLKHAENFSAVWQDGKPELAKSVLKDDVVSLDLLFGNEVKGYDNWAKMVNGIFKVSGLLPCVMHAMTLLLHLSMLLLSQHLYSILCNMLSLQCSLVETGCPYCHVRQSAVARACM